MKRTDLLMIATAAAIGLTVMTSGMANAQDRGGRAPMTFSELDTNGDGSLTIEDLEARQLERFAEIDTDGNGQVTLEEFQAVAIARAAENAGAMFERLDADGDGMLSRDVLERGDRGFGPRMLERLDADSDGAVTEAEFDAARERMAEMRGGRGGDHDRDGHRGPRVRN